jgi:hypothetical protein
MACCDWIWFGEAHEAGIVFSQADGWRRCYLPLVIALRRMLHFERASKTVALSAVVLYQAQLVKRDSTPSTTMSRPKICCQLNVEKCKKEVLLLGLARSVRRCFKQAK